MIFKLKAILLAATLVRAYDVQIHPEYQQGLAINDVPADRRLHWMRVANEASSPHPKKSMTNDCRPSTQMDILVLKLLSGLR